MEQPKCEYCGCTAIDCLARCTHTGLYFCNGKGDTSNSHIVHHLRTMHFDQIVLPDVNPFASIPLKCYVCESTNIFSLGFLHTKDGQQIFIACRTPCQYHESLVNHDVNNQSFTPIISNGQIIPDVVHIPDNKQYQHVTISKVMAVVEGIKQQLGNTEEQDEDNSKLTPAKLEYESREEYVAILQPFVDAEREENQNLEKTRKFHGINPTWQSDVNCSFKSPPPLYKAVSLGSSLEFKGGDVTEIGYITHMSKNMTLNIKFATPSIFAKQHQSLTVTVVFNSFPFKRQTSALTTFKTDKKCMSNFVANLILGHIDDISKKNHFNGNIPQLCEPPREFFEPLNQSQQKCIRAALSQRFTMIQGPPGTGKTTVIAAIAYSLVRAGIKPVLVCAQSNVATDFATQRVAQTGVRVVRVLSSTREQVATDVDQFTTKKLAAEMYGDKFTTIQFSREEQDRKSITKMEIGVVSQADVVCTTCTSAGGARLTGGNVFRAVIFDESGQCVDPDLLIPLVHGTQQAILVGDHKQLGPVIVSRKCQRGRYDLPLMQRLILLGVRPSVLRTQYRMHPALAKFPSEVFYSGFLNDGVSAEERKWPRTIFNWPNPDIPMFFWNVPSQEEFYESGLSYVNRHEAGCIAVILDAMWKNGVAASDIGVITPYAGQQAFLIESLPQMCVITDRSFFEEIEIASVDAFQGREKNFIILSNVRANDSHEIGFLKDQRRLCVSLTRAKYGLVVIGCANTYSENKLWCKYIEHCKSLGVFVEGKLTDLRQSEFTPSQNAKDEDIDESDSVENSSIF